MLSKIRMLGLVMLLALSCNLVHACPCDDEDETKTTTTIPAPSN